MDKDLILFDFDGTVIDGSEGIFKCINYASDKMNLPRLSPEILRTFIGPSLFDSFTKHYRKDAETVKKIIANYRERYNETGLFEAVLYPDIKEVISKLNSDGYTLCIVSSKPLPFVTKITEHLNIKQYFAGLCCPDFSQNSSEKDWLIGEAVNRFGSSKEKTVMIGDRHFDIDAAKKAGVESIGVTYGFAEENELQLAGADFVVDTPKEFYTLITGKKL